MGCAPRGRASDRPSAEGSAMQLIRPIYRTQEGQRHGHKSHAIQNDKPFCQLRTRTFGDNTSPTAWLLEEGEMPTCPTCARWVTKNIVKAVS